MKGENKEQVVNHDELCDYLIKYISNTNDIKIDKSTKLLDEGLIDSFNVLEILSLLEDKLHIKINPREVSINVFSSIDTLVTWLISCYFNPIER